MIPSGHIYIIAEAGVNHNGSLETAKKLIDAAADAGADAVKFQTFKADELVSSTAPKADYQKAATGSTESQLDMLKKLELDESAHRVLADHCRKRDIQFLSTPFDEDSVDLLTTRIKVSMLKLSSGEITNGPLLLHAARTGLPVILSTGMSTLADIKAALGVLAFGYTVKKDKPSQKAFKAAFSSARGQRSLKERVTLLHCTTEYPAPFAEVNLRAMDTMREAFCLPVGLSDHTPGIAISIAAAALGAEMIEKHFTLDRTLPGPDHKASLVPDELRQLVQSVREVEAALGSARKAPTKSEQKNVRIARRSLVALKDVARGEIFTRENLGSKRPGAGDSPFGYWQLLGKKSAKNYRKDEMIKT
ncbi:MAG: N-acetylneuraminate synthase [Nitrospirae bacterium GWC2_56_14]|nr:MAG: N-acetylneuraminate synthase [Nitrospirae bacterium GWC2_56_14]